MAAVSWRGDSPQNMLKLQSLPRNLTAVLVFGRPPLAFGAFVCALWVVSTHNPLGYMLGVIFLILAMAFDWVDGWFADRYIPDSRLGPLVDRMMDRVVYSIIFPVLGAGMFWRLFRLEETTQGGVSRADLVHAIFVLSICVLVLMRDQVAHFLRSFAEGKGQSGESYQLTRLRAMVASPIALLLYAYAFYQPTDGWEWFYRWFDWLDQLPLRLLYVIEIFFLVINIASVTLHLRKYGRLALDDVCEDDEVLRRRILAVLPNGLTLLNGLFGIAAIVFASHGLVREALFILLGAALFDKLDGTLARRLGLTDPLPEEKRKPGFRLGPLLDDISDAISFCIAPAIILVVVMEDLEMPAPPGLPFWAVGIVYAAAGLARLVFFTLDKSPIPGFFKGMPVPAAALLTVPAVEITHQLARGGMPMAQMAGLLTAGLFLVGAIAMNLYAVRYLHMGRWIGRHPALLWMFIAGSVVGVFTPYFGGAILAFLLLYLFSPMATSHIDPAIAQIENKVPRPR